MSWTFEQKKKFAEAILYIYKEGSHCRGPDGRFIAKSNCEIDVPPPKPNIKITAYYRIKKTHQHSRYGQPREDRGNWIEAEANATVVIPHERLGYLSDILDDLWNACAAVLSDKWVSGWTWSGIQPDHMEASNYETENTTINATYPMAHVEWFINTPRARPTGKGMYKI